MCAKFRGSGGAGRRPPRPARGAVTRGHASAAAAWVPVCLARANGRGAHEHKLAVFGDGLKAVSRTPQARAPDYGPARGQARKL